VSGYQDVEALDTLNRELKASR